MASPAPRYLGLLLVKSFARIHWQNLVSYGVLPLTFRDESDYDAIERDAVLEIRDVHKQLTSGSDITVHVNSGAETIAAVSELSTRQIEVLRHAGLFPWIRQRREAADSHPSATPVRNSS